MEPTDQTTQQKMFTFIDAWKGSGQSQLAFCKDNGIAYARFHYWLKKHSDQNQSRAHTSFSQVRVPSLNATNGAIEVCYPDGRKVIFHQPVEVSFLRNLLA